MNKTEILSTLEEIFIDLLDDDTFELTETASQETVQGWDSLMHITLIASIEDEFKVHFSSDEIAASKSIEKIMQVIERELEKK